jgi:hypothetical protein
LPIASTSSATTTGWTRPAPTTTVPAAGAPTTAPRTASRTPRDARDRAAGPCAPGGDASIRASIPTAPKDHGRAAPPGTD